MTLDPGLSVTMWPGSILWAVPMTDITLVDICFFQFGLSHDLDRGELKLTLDDVKAGLETGNVFAWLKAQGFSGDLSLFHGGDYEARGQKLTTMLLEEDAVFEGRERRKLGIERNGLCYLMSLTVELIQSLNWKDERLPQPVLH